MRGNAHVRFGGRAEETDEPQGPHRASVRPDHTHATLLLKAGVPVKVVSERLGHSSVAFTMQVYQHVLPGMQADAAAKFSEVVFGDEGLRHSQRGSTISLTRAPTGRRNLCGRTRERTRPAGRPFTGERRDAVVAVEELFRRPPWWSTLAKAQFLALLRDA